jgi:glycine cleavage system H protein
MPASGVVTEVNEDLRADPSLANIDPLGKGWFFKVKLLDSAQLVALMDDAAYAKFEA